jgi:hypothetical protein
MRLPNVILTCALAALPVFAGTAQTGAIEGAVNADSLRKRSVPGAEISIPALHLTTQTNFAGEYHLGGITPGRYLVVATAVGLRSVGDSVSIAPGGTTYLDFVLATRAIVLDSVVSKAPAQRKYISPSLNAFEERRLSGSGGYFITDSILRKEEGRPLWEVIRAHVPGASMVFPPNSFAVYLVSGRAPSNRVLIEPAASKSCFPDVYLDGVSLAPATATATSSPTVDLTRFLTPEIGAVEFYAGGASLPIQFNHTSSGCGALLLWSREK